MSDTTYAAIFTLFSMLLGGWLAIGSDHGVPVWMWVIGFIAVGSVFTFILHIRLERNRDGL